MKLLTSETIFWIAVYQKELVADIEGHVHSSVAFKKLLIALLTVLKVTRSIKKIVCHH